MDPNETPIGDRTRALTRRQLGRIALGGAVGATLFNGASPSSASVRPQSPGIKLAIAGRANPSDEDILFLKQLGIGYVFCAVTPEFNSVEGLQQIKKRYSDAGITVHDVRNMAVTTDLTDVVLGRPGRDQKIEDFKAWLRTAGRAGFPYTVAAFFAVGVLQTGWAAERASQTRDFDLASPNLSLMGAPNGNPGAAPPLKPVGASNSPVFGRQYTRDEIWENYTYFIKQVAPVAEEEGITIGFHPDDPPVLELFGVPRLLSSFAGYKRALEIANSPNVGLCLCCGTWAEGGAAMGMDPGEAVRYFGAQKKIFEIHYRNVSSPLPHFHETAMDDGYYDMYKIMKALVDVKYDGIVHLDHPVPMTGGEKTYTAYAVGYMRAQLQRAQAEKS